MERWKSRGGTSQGGEEKKWEDQRRERERRKMQVREKAEKSRFTLIFQWFVALEGRKVGSVKLSGQMKGEQLRAVGARSTFRSQHVQNTPASDHFWKLRCRKSARHCGASTFPSQHVKSTTCSGHFWTLRCQKSAHRCGPKHTSLHFVTTTTQHQLQLHYITLHALH